MLNPESTDCWIVMYRGNGYGLFLDEDFANEVAKFIPKRNERKFRTNQLGKYSVHIIKTTLEYALQTVRLPVTPPGREKGGGE